MAEVELELNDLSAPELIATGKRLIDGLKGNPNFPEPKPPLDEIAAKLTQLEAVQEEYRKHRLKLNEMKTARDAAMGELRGALACEAEYVQEASGGDAKKIMSANLEAEHSWSFWPFGSLPQVIDLSASTGEQAGEIDLVWDPVRGANGYEIECATDIAGEDSWFGCGTSTESRATLKNLESRCRYWFRVRAVGKKGEGDWSDPVTKYTR